LKQTYFRPCGFPALDGSRYCEKRASGEGRLGV